VVWAIEDEHDIRLHLDHFLKELVLLFRSWVAFEAHSHRLAVDSGQSILHNGVDEVVDDHVTALEVLLYLARHELVWVVSKSVLDQV
jgi:hypothetical protein